MARAMDNAILETILQRVRPLIGQGKVADYIPALASVEGSKLGIAICTVDGQHYQAGDAHERFSIQSISKVLSLVVAMRHYPEEEIWQRVGKDPSGSPFNSLVQLEMEQGIPRNPFINAGALVVCDMLQGRLSAPRQRMLEVVRALCGVSDITYDATVARSEFEHSARNAAIAWRVGLPAKSGVGGGIVAIVPHEMAIAVWSPELDPAGNSLAGIAALEQLTQTLGRSVY
ncbi:glutaminase [Salmonella enterica]|nr:glutaminase [Salmonella enterica]